MKVLNNIVSGYFDFAEARAIERQTMTMQDYKYVKKTLSPIEQEYLNSIKMLSDKGKKEK
ncbi:MAG: virulence RhuM family protein [Tannerella sp.]|nr:virulence RhuM family protein [Tannerella sp.]